MRLSSDRAFINIAPLLPAGEKVAEGRMRGSRAYKLDRSERAADPLIRPLRHLLPRGEKAVRQRAEKARSCRDSGAFSNSAPLLPGGEKA